MTTGAPKTAVTELTPNSVGAKAVRAIRSQNRQMCIRDRAEAVYGVQLDWDFDLTDIETPLAEPLRFYAEREMWYICDRVETCIKMQKAKLEW